MQVTATNRNGMIAKWIGRGATLTELHVPDRDGKLADVVLGFDDVAGYESGANQHFGCTTGRFANRIRGGKFTLDGIDYQLAVNNGPNHLHGGPQRALDKVTWDAERLENGVRFAYSSPDGEEGFPGKLDLEVAYTFVDYRDSGNALRIDYTATTDKPTIINLTNHSYFNLSGHGAGSVLDHEVWIDADRYTIVDDSAIPDGELAEVADTPFDFRTRKPLAAHIDRLSGGYDHNFVLNHFFAKNGHDGRVGGATDNGSETGGSHSNRPVALIAEVVDHESGRVMEVATDQPGVQLYTGNGLHGQMGKRGRCYPCHSAVCLETQHFPDSPNQPGFPSTVLRPGKTYRQVCIYAFGNMTG